MTWAFRHSCDAKAMADFKAALSKKCMRHWNQSVLLHCNIFRLRFVAEEDSDSEYDVRPTERRAISDRDRCSHSSNLASGSDRHRTRADRCVDVPFGLRVHPANSACNILNRITTDYSMLSFARQPPITKMTLRLAESTA